MTNIFIPGSYSPLHSSHLFLAHHSKSLYPNSIQYFVISGINADKEQISFDVGQDRKRQFDNLGRKSYISYQKTIVGQVVNEMLKYAPPINKFAPDTTVIVIGADTFNRVIDNKYACNSQDELNHSFKHMINLGCKILVYPRIGYEIDTSIYDNRADEAEFFYNIDLEELFSFQTVTPPEMSSTKIRECQAKSISTVNIGSADSK